MCPWYSGSTWTLLWICRQWWITALPTWPVPTCTLCVRMRCRLQSSGRSWTSSRVRTSPVSVEQKCSILWHLLVSFLQAPTVRTPPLSSPLMISLQRWKHFGRQFQMRSCWDSETWSRNSNVEQWKQASLLICVDMEMRHRIFVFPLKVTSLHHLLNQPIRKNVNSWFPVSLDWWQQTETDIKQLLCQNYCTFIEFPVYWHFVFLFTGWATDVVSHLKVEVGDTVNVCYVKLLK